MTGSNRRGAENLPWLSDAASTTSPSIASRSTASSTVSAFTSEALVDPSITPRTIHDDVYLLPLSNQPRAYSGQSGSHSQRNPSSRTTPYSSPPLYSNGSQLRGLSPYFNPASPYASAFSGHGISALLRGHLDPAQSYSAMLASMGRDLHRQHTSSTNSQLPQSLYLSSTSLPHSYRDFPNPNPLATGRVETGGPRGTPLTIASYQDLPLHHSLPDSKRVSEGVPRRHYSDTLPTCSPQSSQRKSHHLLEKVSSSLEGQFTGYSMSNSRENQPDKQHLNPFHPQSASSTGADSKDHILRDSDSPLSKIPKSHSGNIVDNKLSMKHRTLPLVKSTEVDSGSGIAAAATVTERSALSASGAIPPHCPPHFYLGSIIQLANGQMKQVEDLQTEDFIQSAHVSSELKIDSSTVVKINCDHKKGTAILGFCVGEHKVEVTAEAMLEHPFFVFGQGWSSCSPEKTLLRYKLPCQMLSVGDVCISLTHRDVVAHFSKMPKREPSCSPSQSTEAEVMTTGNGMGYSISSTVSLPSVDSTIKKEPQTPTISSADSQTQIKQNLSSGLSQQGYGHRPDIKLSPTPSTYPETQYGTIPDTRVFTTSPSDGSKRRRRPDELTPPMTSTPAHNVYSSIPARTTSNTYSPHGHMSGKLTPHLYTTQSDDRPT